MQKAPIYFDYMATTPVDSRVAEQMANCLTKDGIFGNPASSSHQYGLDAQCAVQKARGQVAGLINASSGDIIWTSGATESNNLALFGAARFHRRNGTHIVTSKTEHKAVLDCCKQLEREGFSVTYLSPDSKGVITPAVLEQALQPDTILVSIMHANNEIGTIQDIKSLTAVTRPRGILFHCDCAQSAGKIPVDVQAMDVDLASLSAHKMYGPKGMGALYVRSKPRVRLAPLIFGGGHEQGLRSGTLATHQIVGMGAACDIASQELSAEVQRTTQLREQLWAGINTLGDISLNGHATKRLPGNLNFSVKGVDGESLMLALNPLAISSTSACTSASIEPSHVLTAIGTPQALAHSAVRVAVGRFTQDEDISFAIQLINQQVKRLRQLSPV